MTSLFQLARSLLSSFLIYLVYRLAKLVYHELTSPLRNISGPPSKSFLFGHLKELVIDAKDNSTQHDWGVKYGKVMKFNGYFGVTGLYTSDTKAINHILMHDYDYQKPKAPLYEVRRLLGDGIVTAEEDVHKAQRKIVNPAFGAPQIRVLTQIFIAKSIQLRDIWAAEISQKDGPVQINALPWLSKMTLDIIGLAGFNYKFNALTDDAETNELNKAFSVLFQAGTTKIFPLLRGFFPVLRLLPADLDAETKQATETMARIGAQLLRESKASAELNGKDKDFGDARDILSMLVRANTASDVPEDQRISDNDVVAQIPTFLVAGHETTSSGATWALFALTQHQEIQAKLRAELQAVHTDNPTMDELNALPYLDAVIRETLRLYPPVPFGAREAMKNDIIPLSGPYTDKHGRIHHEIRIRKGDAVYISIAGLNCEEGIWGNNSTEFKPERWESIPDAVHSIPGVWGNILTFSGGARSCIGYRFSLIEMKAILFTMLRAFEFELAVPAKDIAMKLRMAQRPVLLTDPNNANQMPLLVRPVPHA